MLTNNEQDQDNGIKTVTGEGILPPVTVLYKSPYQQQPVRLENGNFMFTDYADFLPNLSPKEIMNAGSFGGTYFRNITSTVTGHSYNGREIIMKHFPEDWIQNLDIDIFLCASEYDKMKNLYKVKCGSSLEDWETSGWISSIDPYGWFQWFCFFFLGRRSSDDERQIKRWIRGYGPNGRWRLRLCNLIQKSGKNFDDVTVSPVIRQVLLHWAYQLTNSDYLEFCNR